MVYVWFEQNQKKKMKKIEIKTDRIFVSSGWVFIHLMINDWHFFLLPLLRKSSKNPLP